MTLRLFGFSCWRPAFPLLQNLHWAYWTTNFFSLGRDNLFLEFRYVYERFEEGSFSPSLRVKNPSHFSLVLLRCVQPAIRTAPLGSLLSKV
jgi:hypothetical protein